MKTNQKTLRLPQWIVAAVAVLALIAGVVLLFYFSQVSLLLVFAPAVVALVGGAVLVIVNRKFFDLAGVLALVGTAVYGYTVSEQAFANVQGLAYVPLLVFFVVFLLLRDTAATKESFRKFLVSLKRNPQYIPLVMLFITFLVYTLNLTDVSDTTAKILGRGMGLSQFCIMLFSLLSMVCMLNAFPRRKKANIPMVVLMFIMFGIIIFCDIHYPHGKPRGPNRIHPKSIRYAGCPHGIDYRDGCVGGAAARLQKAVQEDQHLRGCGIRRRYGRNRDQRIKIS